MIVIQFGEHWGSISSGIGAMSVGLLIVLVLTGLGKSGGINGSVIACDSQAVSVGRMCEATVPEVPFTQLQGAWLLEVGKSCLRLGLLC